MSDFPVQRSRRRRRSRRRLLFPAALCLALSLATAAASARPPAHPTRLIVKASGGECLAAALGKALPAAKAAPLVDPASVVGSLVGGELWVVDAGDRQAAAAALAKAGKGCIEYVEPDWAGHGAGTRREPDDPLFPRQWHLDDAGDTDTDAPEAWAITTGGDVLVAVLDTGVDTGHPALGAVVAGGVDFVNGDDDPADDYGHGTCVASEIAERGDDAAGGAGVSWGARILAVKVLDDRNWGYYSWWVSGIGWAVAHGARVVNMSLGGTERSRALEDAVAIAVGAGVTVVAAMMNDGDATVYYPAAYDGVIAVGATGADGARVSVERGAGWGSNYGDHIDVAAPGASIFAARLGGGYEAWNGTSMSAALVSGAAALILGLDGERGPAEVEALIESGARDGEGGAEDTAGWDRWLGAGRLDLDGALAGLRIDADDDGFPIPEDCDDTDGTVNPGADEVPGNGKDDDCDPMTPDTVMEDDRAEGRPDAGEGEGEGEGGGCGCSVCR